MKLTVISSIILGIAVSACGGGGSETASPVVEALVVTTPTTSTTPATFTGMFVDSAVEGLSYSTPSGSGVTDENGEFTYQMDEKVTFSLGGITFPEIDAKSIITPLDLFDTMELDHEAVVNTLRLLQSLDADGDADNGIQISELVRTFASMVTLDLSDTDFESKMTALLSNSGLLNSVLVSSTDAIAHFQMTLDALEGNGRCTKNHSKVGYSGSFSSLAHNVSGTATIIDDCTIEVTSFTYDGGGPSVYFYAGIDHQYSASTAFPIGSQLNGQVYNGETIEVTLPNGKTFDDLTGLSVWCADFNADFGNMTFTP